MGNGWLGFPTFPANQNNVSMLNCFALFYDFTANPRKMICLYFFGEKYCNFAEHVNLC